jgi:hypothetical protein
VDATDQIGFGKLCRGGKRKEKDKGKEKTLSRWQERQPDTVRNYGFLSYLLRSEGGKQPMLDGELRRGEQSLSRTRVCVDRVGIVDDMRFFRLPSSPGVVHE